MSPTKRALLIGSPYGNLRGTENDVHTMMKILESKGFMHISQCCGPEATRQGIITKWTALISQTDPGDAVVVYYSGHGALVKPSHNGSGKQLQSRVFQFIVPTDYDESNVEDFRGILDIELSDLLKQITDKTRNTTVILDCCHSGRMARGSAYSSPKFLPEIRHHDIEHLVRKFIHSNRQEYNEHSEGNPWTVRIVACSQNETAWEDQGEDKRWQGALTKALGRALEETAEQHISWHTTLMRVRDILMASANLQHPNVEGPSKRIHFTLEQSDPGSFRFRLENGTAIVDAGKISSCATDDVFAILPHGCESQAAWIAKVKLVSVGTFAATAKFIEVLSGESPPHEGVAIQIEKALRPLPIRLPPAMHELQKTVEISRYLRSSTSDDTERLPFIRCENDRTILYSEDGIEVFCSSPGAPCQTVYAAEQLVRARLLRALEPDVSEKLTHRLEIDFDVITGGNRRNISFSGTTYVFEADRACIWLYNRV